MRTEARPYPCRRLCPCLCLCVCLLCLPFISGCLGPIVESDVVETGIEEPGPADVHVRNTDDTRHRVAVSVRTNETVVHALSVPAGSTETVEGAGPTPDEGAASYNVTVRALGGPERGRVWRVSAERRDLTVGYDGERIRFEQETREVGADG